MLDLPERPRFGGYVLTRSLAPFRFGARLLALHEADQSSHTLYVLSQAADELDRSIMQDGLTRIANLVHSHILRIERFEIDAEGVIRLVTPYTGDVDGVLTLERLLRSRSGRLSPHEAERVMVHVLEAMAEGHSTGLLHGSISTDDILIDRHGSVCMELWGLPKLVAQASRGRAAQTEKTPAFGDLISDETRSVVEIGYRLLTGLRPETPLIPAERLVRRLDPRWRSWFDDGLDPSGGYADARSALSALTHPAGTLQARVRSAIQRQFGTSSTFGR